MGFVIAQGVRKARRGWFVPGVDLILIKTSYIHLHGYLAIVPKVWQLLAFVSARMLSARLEYASLTSSGNFWFFLWTFLSKIPDF